MNSFSFRRYAYCLVSALTFFLTSGSPGAQPAPRLDPAKPAAIGRWTARFLNGGLALDYDGVTLTRGGLIQLFSANYAHGYYGSGSNPPPATVRETSDGGRIYSARFRYAADGRTFDGLQEIEVHPANRLVFTLHARWNAPETALLEWNPLRLWAYALIGADYSARTVDGKYVEGKVGFTPLPANANRLTAAWTDFTLNHTAIGDLTLHAQGDETILEDGRSDPYLQDDRIFWCGLAGQPLQPGKEVVDTLTLEVTPKTADPPARPAHEALTALPATLLPIPSAQIGLPPFTDPDGHPLIVPRPKQVRFTHGAYVLAEALPATWGMPSFRNETLAPLLSELIRLKGQLQQDYGVRMDYPPGTVGRAYAPWNGRGLLLTTSGSDSRFRLQDKSLPTAPDHAEGYTLRVNPKAIVLIGHDLSGAYYGLQTLKQLIQRRPGSAASLPCCEIHDWPSLAFRGAHLFTGRSALPFHKKLIERIFSRYKLNRFVIECEYTQWKSHPEIRVPNAMPADDLREEVAFARGHNIEPIPLVNTLGHSEWIFKNNRHLAIAEDVQSPHAYNVSDPATYRFVFDIFRETLDLFNHPRFFHIGHDEVKIPAFDQFGRYPARPVNLKKGTTRLFVEDTHRLAGWLRAHGARAMLWADMLLNENEGTPSPGNGRMSAANALTLAEARRMRAQIPKDAVICDWRYGAGSEQRNGLQVLKQAGFDTIGCSWYEPDNIRGWAKQAVHRHALGTLQTTWAGYDSAEALLDTDCRQFQAFVLAAECAWTGGEEGVKGDTSAPTVKSATPWTWPTPAQLFARAYRDPLVFGKTRSGWALRLGEVANLRLRPEVKEGLPWQGMPSHALEPKLPGYLPARVKPILAVGYERDSGLAVPVPQEGVMLRGVLPLPPVTGQTAIPALPDGIVLPIGSKASTLAFLHACAAGAPRESRAATYTAVYADGRRVEIPLRYGFEISALDDPSPSDALSVTLVPCRPGASNLAARLYRWTNPRPEVEITQLEFRSDDPHVAPILFSVTGVR